MSARETADSSTPSPVLTTVAPSRGSRAARWIAALTAIVVVFGGVGALAGVHTPSETAAIIYLNPHPDDEYQHWALLENRADIVSIVVLLTRGEQTAFCEADVLLLGWQEGLEPAPRPLPKGRFSDSCAEARVNAFTAYFRDMADSDETVPGRFAPPTTTAPLPDPQNVVCRVDDPDLEGGGAVDPDACLVSTSADIYQDLDGRGALVVFDLGDGDLSDAEVEWAVRTVLDELVPVLVPSSARVAGIVGGYSTPAGGFPGCFPYAHPDHLAVDRVLWSTDFGAGFQASATCATDPRRQLFARVSQSATEAAFATEPVEGSDDVRRTGAHTANYGWLHATYYPVSRFGQAELFHQDQHYWVRFW